MTTYRQIHGRSIQAVTTDPTGDVAEGQIWYNTTSDTFKSVLTQEAWVASNKMNTPRATMAGGGVRTSAIISGKHGANPSDASLAESYNGTGWSNLTNVPAPRGYASGTGSDSEEYVQAGGGYPSKTTDVYDWDGSSWTSGTAIPTATIEAGMCGPAADAFFFGGNNGLTTSYERSGGSWTSGGTMAAGVYAPSAVGTQTAAISMGGVKYPGGYQNDNQSYDGTSWTALTDLPAVRGYAGGAGVQTLAMVIAGEGPPTYSSNLEWNGSSWTTLASLATARNTLAKGATTTDTAIAPPGNQTPATTEEYNRSINVITAAAFSSGGNLNTARYDIVGTGLQTAAVAAGGYSSSRIGNTENYDGSAWTNSSTKPTAVFAGAMVGTQTAAFYASGNNAPSGGRTASTEEYDGSNWTSGGNVNTARQQIGAQNGGTLTAGIIFGGNGGPTATEHYDGTSWSTQPATLNDGRWNAVGTGNQSAAVMAGADNPATANVEEYNGTAWSEVNNLPEIRYSGATIGTTQTDYIMASGQNPGGFLTSCVRYDGTNWATSPSNSTARSLLGGSSQAPTSAGLIYGGYTVPGNKADTEEWNGEISSVNVKTLTQS